MGRPVGRCFLEGGVMRVSVSRGVRRSLGLVAVGSLVLVACGNDDGGSSEAPVTQAPATQAPATQAPGGSDSTAAPSTEAPVEYEDVTIQMASFLSPNTSQGQAITWWINELESRTGGAVEVETFWEASLLGAQEIRDGVRDGRVQLGNMTYAYTPGDFPLTSMVEVPFLGGSVGAQAEALNQMYANNEAFRAEWEDQGIKVMSFVGIPSALTGSKEPVTSIDWFEGKTVRGSGFYVKALEAIGGVPAAIPVTDVYEAMQRGTIDAYGGLIIDVIAPTGLHEVGPYIHDAGMGHYANSTFVMSLDAWNGLSPQLQALMEELNAQFVTELVRADGTATTTACNQILDEGGEVSIFAPEETARWAEALGDAPLSDWIAKAESVGVADGAAMYAEFQGYYEAADSVGPLAGAPSPMETCVQIQSERG